MSRFSLFALTSLSALLLSACGEPAVPCVTDNQCIAAGAAVCDATTKTCAQGAARATAIGSKDGTPTSVTLTLVQEPDAPRKSTGLGFNPARPNELWVVNYQDDSVFIIKDVGTPQQSFVRMRDVAAGHFMDKPTSISFAEDGSWGVCGDTDNSQNGGEGFMGPAVFSSDFDIFPKPTPGGLGSHLDMLHASPFSMGIAHELKNAYWVFDGYNGAIVRYDFKEFHEPGADDHSDGEIRFYAMNQVKRVEGVPSNLVFNKADNFVYACDTGNKRIVKVDSRSGTLGDEMPSLEPAIPSMMNGVTFAEVVAPGTLDQPSGIALKDGVLYVTDHASGKFFAFDTSGKLLRTLDTGLGAGALAGITFGPDGKIYFADMNTSRVYRIDP